MDGITNDVNSPPLADDGANEAKRKEVADKTLDRLKSFAEDLEAGKHDDLLRPSVGSCIVDINATSLDVSNAAYELLLNQCVTLRAIADKAAHVAIGETDLSEFAAGDVEILQQYMQQCEYIELEEDADTRAVLIEEVLKPLLSAGSGGTGVDGLIDFLSLSRRELARKQRIKDELGQLQVMADTFTAQAVDVPQDILTELAAARIALLFASSDVLDYGLLMTLSPSVRIAQRLADVRERARADGVASHVAGGNGGLGAEIDWSGVEGAGTPAEKEAA